jgi:ABC-type transporter Mla maintaining outer membrane lipid asymmetry ATPase subunit MlaF
MTQPFSVLPVLFPGQGEVLIKGEPRRGLISDDDTSDKLKVGLVFQVGAAAPPARQTRA